MDEDWDGRQEWRRELQRHKDDAYAHSALVGRLLQENASLRQRLDQRIAEVENRLGMLESFRGQVVLLGGIGYLILGVVLAGLLQRLFNISL